MARLISETGLTASTTIGSPQQGMKWVVKWALVIINTGTAAGSRTASIYVYQANTSGTGSTGSIILAQLTTSSTSAIISGIGSTSSRIGGNAVNLTQYYQYPEFFAVDVINLYVGIQSGDTVDYYLMVEEVPS